MPAQPFTVHVDPDDLARQDLAAAVHLPTVGGAGTHRPGRRRRGRTPRRPGRVAGRASAFRAGTVQPRPASGSGRSYAFRRS